MSIEASREKKGHEAKKTEDQSREFKIKAAEYTHQEHLEARHLVQCLKRYDEEAYASLRTHKYDPTYRKILNFLCHEMTPKKYPAFWQMLLQEKTDVMGFAHLQLLLSSLEAAHYDDNISDLQKHLQHIAQVLLNAINLGKDHYEYRSWLADVLTYCPGIWRQLGNEFYKEFEKLLVTGSPGIRRSGIALLKKMTHSLDQLSPERRAWWWHSLFHALEDKDFGVREAAIQALGACVKEVAQFSLEERTKWLAVLFNVAEDKDWEVRKEALEELGICASHAAQFLPEERAGLLAVLFKGVEDKEDKVRRAAAGALKVCARHAAQFSPKQRAELFSILFKIAGSEKDRSIMGEALGVYPTQAAQFLPEERAELLAVLLEVVRDKESKVKLAAIGALSTYASQAAQFSPVERAELLGALLKAVKGEGEYLTVQAFSAYAKEAVMIPEERAEMFATLLEMAKDEKEHVQWAGVHALSASISHAVPCSTEEWTELLAVLLRAAEGKDVPREVAKALCACASHVSQFLPKERLNLLNALFKAARDKDWCVRMVAVEALGACANHIEQFLLKKRFRLFLVLGRIASRDENSNVRSAVVEALHACVSSQAAVQLLPHERAMLLAILSKAAKDKDCYMEMAAIQALGACGNQAAQFLPEERYELLSEFFNRAKNKEVHVRWRVAIALNVWANHAAEFPKERFILLGALLKVAGDEDYWRVQMTAAEAIGAYARQVAVTPKEHTALLTAFLKAAKKEKDGRAALQACLKSDHHDLLRLPVDLLLLAYFAEAASQSDSSELWLQFFAGRAVAEHISVVIEGDRIQLISPQAPQAIYVAFPDKDKDCIAALVNQLREALASQLKPLGLFLPVPLPAKDAQASVTAVPSVFWNLPDGKGVRSPTPVVQLSSSCQLNESTMIKR